MPTGSPVIRRWTGRGAPRRAARGLALICEIALLAMLALLTARVVWLVVFGTSAIEMDIAAPQDRLPEVRRTVDLSALQSGRLFAAPDMPAISAETIAPETALDLTLYGVRRGADPQTGSAVIEAGAAGQRSHAVGSEIIEGVTLEAVYPDRVTIRRRGIAESLYLREEARRNASLPTAALSDDGSAAAQFWAAIQIVPDFRDGTLFGYRLTEASRADLLARTRLQAGDVITAVNGIRIGSGSDIGRVMNEVGRADRLRLEIERGGATQTIDVESP